MRSKRYGGGGDVDMLKEYNWKDIEAVVGLVGER